MLIKNKLDKTFGSVGTNAGIILFIAGLFVIFNSLLFGVVLFCWVLLLAFLHQDLLLIPIKKG